MPDTPDTPEPTVERLDYDFTLADLRAALDRVVPPDIDPSTVSVEINVSVGMFPSGEPGAEDWIMSAGPPAIEFWPANEHRGPTLYLEIDYS